MGRGEQRPMPWDQRRPEVGANQEKGSMIASSQTRAGHTPQPADPSWLEFSAPLRRFLRARTQTDADADDLMQEVFVRILKRLPSLREPAKIQGWVYRIARNVVIDHYRSRREHVALDFDLEAEDPTGRDAVDLSGSLKRFVASLPIKYREPLVRHEFQGQSLAEVGTELGLSLTATKSRVRRARLMLRAMLDQCCRFELDRRGRVIEAIPRAQCRCDAEKSNA